jgi:hypothetical protein
VKSRTTVTVLSWLLFCCGTLGIAASVLGEVHSATPVLLIALAMGGFWLLAYIDSRQ